MENILKMEFYTIEKEEICLVENVTLKCGREIYFLSSSFSFASTIEFPHH